MGQLTNDSIPRVLIFHDNLSMRQAWMEVIRQLIPAVEISATDSVTECQRLLTSQEKIKRPFDYVVGEIFIRGEPYGIELWKKFAKSTTKFIFNSKLDRKIFLKLTASADPAATPILLPKVGSPEELRAAIKLHMSVV